MVPSSSFPVSIFFDIAGKGWDYNLREDHIDSLLSTNAILSFLDSKVSDKKVKTTWNKGTASAVQIEQIMIGNVALSCWP